MDFLTYFKYKYIAVLSNKTPITTHNLKINLKMFRIIESMLFKVE
jgi:hypothetical protein